MLDGMREFRKQPRQVSLILCCWLFLTGLGAFLWNGLVGLAVWFLVSVPLIVVVLVGFALDCWTKNRQGIAPSSLAKEDDSDVN